MTFVQQCIADSLPIWEKCLRSEFISSLAEGTLDEDCFKGYIVEDSLYLREYARVFAWGILHANDMEEIRTYYSLLSFVNEAESSTRRYYLARYNMTDEQINALPMRPNAEKYVRIMHESAEHAEGPAECLMACLPCMLSYAWIFKQVLEEHPGIMDTCYGRFMSDYADNWYFDRCAMWLEAAEKACTDLSEERQAKCLGVFRACSLCELGFWNMCMEPRTDI